MEHLCVWRETGQIMLVDLWCFPYNKNKAVLLPLTYVTECREAGNSCICVPMQGYGVGDGSNIKAASQEWRYLWESI